MKIFKLLYCLLFGHKPYLLENKYSLIEAHHENEIRKVFICDRCNFIVQINNIDTDTILLSD